MLHKLLRVKYEQIKLSVTEYTTEVNVQHKVNKWKKLKQWKFTNILKMITKIQITHTRHPHEGHCIHKSASKSLQGNKWRNSIKWRNMAVCKGSMQWEVGQVGACRNKVEHEGTYLGSHLIQII